MVMLEPGSACCHCHPGSPYPKAAPACIAIITLLAILALSPLTFPLPSLLLLSVGLAKTAAAAARARYPRYLHKAAARRAQVRRLTRLVGLWDRASTDVMALSKPCSSPRPRWVPEERRSPRRNPFNRCTVRCSGAPCTVHVPSLRVTRYEPESEPSMLQDGRGDEGTCKEGRSGTRRESRAEERTRTTI